MAKMQGVILPGNSSVEFREFDIPKPGHGQVLVKTMASTICGSDIRCIYREHTGKGAEGYIPGTIAGHEKLIKEFFLASISFETFKTDKNGRRTMRMTNNTSLDYTLNFGGNPVQLRAFTSRNVTVAKEKELIFTVENMWIPTEEKHPQFKLKL